MAKMSNDDFNKETTFKKLSSCSTFIHTDYTVVHIG